MKSKIKIVIPYLSDENEFIYIFKNKYYERMFFQQKENHQNTNFLKQLYSWKLYAILTVSKHTFRTISFRDFSVSENKLRFEKFHWFAVYQYEILWLFLKHKFQEVSVSTFDGYCIEIVGYNISINVFTVSRNNFHSFFISKIQPSGFHLFAKKNVSVKLRRCGKLFSVICASCVEIHREQRISIFRYQVFTISFSSTPSFPIVPLISGLFSKNSFLNMEFTIRFFISMFFSHSHFCWLWLMIIFINMKFGVEHSLCHPKN